MSAHRHPRQSSFRPHAPLLLSASECIDLANALADTPGTVIAGHVLRRGSARATVLGSPTHFQAAIVQNLAFGTDELIGFGDDADALWSILRLLDGWACVLVDLAVADKLGLLIGKTTGSALRTLADIYHVLEQPPSAIPLAPARVLSVDDAWLLAGTPESLRAGGYSSIPELLNEGVSAAAIVDGTIVSLAHTSARSVAYADIAVATLPPWRIPGPATAAAALVIHQVQAAGQIPVWSTGETNAASLRMAAKLGFVETTRRTYIIR